MKCIGKIMVNPHRNSCDNADCTNHENCNTCLHWSASRGWFRRCDHRKKTTCIWYHCDMYTKKEQLRRLADELDHLNKPDARKQRPKLGEKFWIVENNGFIYRATSDGCEHEKELFKMGCYFRTKKIAMKARTKMREIFRSVK